MLVAASIRQFAGRSVTEKLGIRSVYASYQPVTLPSPRQLFGAALNTHQVRHPAPGALLRPMSASDLRSELIT